LKLWKKALIFFVAVIGLGFIFNNVVMPWYVRHNTLVKVPSVVGLSFEEAKKKLDAAGLEGMQGDIRYDPSKTIGTVIDQLPLADQIVKDSRRIYLVISGGEQLYDVPNLVGRTVRESKFILSQRNISLNEIEMKPSVQYPSGIILEQKEHPGSKVKKGTVIGVIVSTGMESGNIKVPDLMGKNLEEAKKLILSSKLSIGKVNFQPSTTVPLNSVIDQYPKSNSMAKENDKVDIFVNRETKKTVEEKDEEMNSMDKEMEKKETEKKDTEKKETDKHKDAEKKDDVKKDDKVKPKEEKKETPKIDKDKDKDKKEKDEDGTKF